DPVTFTIYSLSYTPKLLVSFLAEWISVNRKGFLARFLSWN
ncbi:unnamed protein product, partial [Allacma fusca]